MGGEKYNLRTTLPSHILTDYNLDVPRIASKWVGGGEGKLGQTSQHTLLIHQHTHNTPSIHKYIKFCVYYTTHLCNNGGSDEV